MKEASDHRPQVLIAPNALKNSLHALPAAEAIRRGMVRSGFGADCHIHPMADGGDGTVQVLTRCLGGVFRAAEVYDPLGRPVVARFGWVRDQHLAILEMAEASGLRLLDKEELNPMEATSYGTGQLIQAAIKEGAKEIWLGVGGSATVDGGLGALAALGIPVLDREGNAVPGGGHGLQAVERIDLPEQHPLQGITLRILSDVEFPLLGLKGAARMFGPQKGASVPMVKALEHGLQHLTHILKQQGLPDMGHMPRGGAAGGITATFHTLLGAKLESGAAFVMERVGLMDKLPQMDWVITAEGSLDGQSVGGKAPVLLAEEARKHDIPLIALVGQVVDRDEVSKYFDMVFPINPRWESRQFALQHAEEHLCWAAEQVGRLLQRSANGRK